MEVPIRGCYTYALGTGLTLLSEEQSKHLSSNFLSHYKVHSNFFNNHQKFEKNIQFFNIKMAKFYTIYGSSRYYTIGYTHLCIVHGAQTISDITKQRAKEEKKKCIQDPGNLTYLSVF